MFGFEPVKQQVDYAKDRSGQLYLKLRESPMASRLARFGGNAQGANQIERNAERNEQLASNRPRARAGHDK